MTRMPASKFLIPAYCAWLPMVVPATEISDRPRRPVLEASVSVPVTPTRIGIDTSRNDWTWEVENYFICRMPTEPDPRRPAREQLVAEIRKKLGVQTVDIAQGRLLRVLRWVLRGLQDPNNAEQHLPYTNAILDIFEYGPPAAVSISERSAAAVNVVKRRGVIVQAQLQAMSRRSDPDDHELLALIVDELRMQLVVTDERFLDLSTATVAKDLQRANLDTNVRKPAPGPVRVLARWACAVGALGARKRKGRAEEERVFNKLRQSIKDVGKLTRAKDPTMSPSPYEDLDAFDAEIDAIRRRNRHRSQ